MVQCLFRNTEWTSCAAAPSGHAQGNDRRASNVVGRPRPVLAILTIGSQTGKPVGECGDAPARMKPRRRSKRLLRALPSFPALPILRAPMTDPSPVERARASRDASDRVLFTGTRFDVVERQQRNRAG